MSNEDETDVKKPGTLGLRRSGGDAGRVKQSFSHGRSKSVVVEKRRTKRVLKPGETAAKSTAGPDADTSKLRKRTAPAAGSNSSEAAKGKSRKPQVLETLSDDEHARRSKALEASKKAKAEADAKAAADAKKAAEAAAKAEAEAKAAAAAEAEAAAKVAAEEPKEEPAPAAQTSEANAPAEPKAAEVAEPKKADKAAEAPAPAAKDDAPKKRVRKDAKPLKTARPSDAAVAAVRKAAAASSAPASEADKPARTRTRNEDSVKTGDAVDISALTTALPGPKIISKAPPKPKEEQTPDRARPRPGESDSAPAGGGPGPRGGGGRTPARPEREDRTPRNTRGNDNKRRSGKLTIAQATSGNEGRTRSVASMRRRQERERRKQSGPAQPAQKVYREVKIPDAITVQELSNRMTERGGDVIKALMKMDMMVTINQSIDAETAELIVEEFGHTAVRVSEADVDIVIEEVADPEGSLQPRAPIVTIMGHVDHGKTSLLDRLRNANVVDGEAGGITQHIGAYQVKTEAGAVTFLDTPGHAAFTAMRSRGAQVTDIVILVVAADDAVMPQTIEAISHAKAAEVPMIVAINKVDKPAADVNKVRTDLLQHDVQVESMGGEVLDVEVSALTGQGLDKLLEAIILQSELLELKANPDRPADGIVVEAQLDVGRGPVATVLVKRGTLKTGDIFVVGEQWGKVRAMIDDHGERVKTAGPSVPVEVLGLNGTPEAGDSLVAVENEKRALEVAEYRQHVAKEKQAAIGTGRTLDQMLAQAKADAETAELPVVIKADVQGSAEAIIQAMEKIGNDEVRVRILHSGVGAITESDVTLAEASGASIIGFNVRANSAARDAANAKSVELRYYSIIYDLVDDVKAAAAGLLSPEIKETFIGYAEILQTFRVSGVGNVAGCRVTEGVARRSAGVRLLRDNVVIHEGMLKTLKRFKDEVKEVQSGQECGMAFEKYEDIREGDVIEIFETQEIERTLA